MSTWNEDAANIIRTYEGGGVYPDVLAEILDNMQQEWRRIIFNRGGERVDRLTSDWYDDESIARSLLNSEYPAPSPSGWFQLLQSRWVTKTWTVSS